MSPKCHCSVPVREKQGEISQRERERRESDVTPEAKTGWMQPQRRECQEIPETGKDKKGF